MTSTPPEFQPVEIDEVDRKLAATAVRKRIPSLNVSALVPDKGVQAEPEAQPQVAHAPRKTLSIEVPDYLATELKVKAATQSVTVRHLILTVLAAAGYDINPVDMDEDGRRLR